MSALYTIDLLRLATSLGDYPRLMQPHATAERRSIVCGSRITVDLALDDDGHVTGFGQEVQACALGQASAALLARHIIGRTPDEIETARVQLTGFLNGTTDQIGDWPGLDILATAQKFPARHASIRLPFEAAAEAARLAQTS